MPRTQRSPENPVQLILDQIYRSEQLDLLHLAAINLLEMVQNEEISLVLNAPNKTAKSKEQFLKKLVEEVGSPELRNYFSKPLTEKNLAFFSEAALGPLLRALRQEADRFAIVRLTVALKFKEDDMRTMATVLSQKIGKRAALSVRVDSTIIGGALVQYGSYLNDFSLRTQLDVFRSHWHKAVVAEET